MQDINPIIDFEFAMSQLSGNREILQSLLNRFKDDYQTVNLSLQKLVAQSNSEEAIKLVHTIKGVSGNLGLRAVVSSAKKLEQSLRQNSDIDSDLSSFYNALALTMQAIEAFPDEDFSNAHTNTALSLREQLIQNKFIQPHDLKVLVDMLPAAQMDKAKLETLILDLDYPSALALLNHIETP